MTRLQPTPRRVFVDTNVLINDFFHRKKQEELAKPQSVEKAANSAIYYLRSLNGMRLYVASFSLVQLISTLGRAKQPDVIIREELHHILAYYELATLTEADISAALALRGRDLEDIIHYTVCRKVGCTLLLTANVKDFRAFAEVRSVAPAKIRTVLF